jgi:hypothetical protein
LIQSACSADAQCASGSYCNGTSCVPLEGSGTVCARGAQDYDKKAMVVSDPGEGATYLSSSTWVLLTSEPGWFKTKAFRVKQTGVDAMVYVEPKTGAPMLAATTILCPNVAGFG